MPGPNQNHGLDSSKVNQREMGEIFEGARPYYSHWLANQQLEREPNETLWAFSFKEENVTPQIIP